MLSSTPTTSGWPSGTNAATSRPSKILEPCRPDHAPRDRNRWNRLKPLSDAPSTARRAAQTVRWFRHSNAPVASATAFNQVGCVNSTANGASQVSIARAFPGCAIFATIGFPMRQTHGKLRSCLQNLQISAQAADYGDTTEQPGKPPKSSLWYDTPLPCTHGGQRHVPCITHIEMIRAKFEVGFGVAVLSHRSAPVPRPAGPP